MKASFTVTVRSYANGQGGALLAPLFSTLTSAQQQCVYLPRRIPPKSDNRCANCESIVVWAPKRREAVTAPFAQNSRSFVGILYRILFMLGEKCIKLVQKFPLRRSEGHGGCQQCRFIKLHKGDPIKRVVVETNGRNEIGVTKSIR